MVGQTILVEAHSTLKIPATCVERGRWSRRSEHLLPAPQAAYPELRRARRAGQSADSQGRIEQGADLMQDED